MSMFTLAISCLTTSNLPWFMHLTFPRSYAVLLFTASDFASITSHFHNWMLFLLWLCLFILSGVTSSLISSSILDTYQPGEFIFQCHTFLPFHTRGFMGISWQEYWSGLPFPSPVDHILSNSPPWPVRLGWTRHCSLFPWVRQGCGPCNQIG